MLNQWFPANDEIIIKINKEIDAYKEELNELELESKDQEAKFDGLHPHEIRMLPSYISNDDFRSRCDVYIEYYSKKESLRMTIDVLSRYVSKLKHGIYLHTESAEISVQSTGLVSAPKVEKHENVEDVGGEEVDHVDMLNLGLSLHTDNGLSMSGFLERPVQIAAQSLSLNSDIDLTFNIWNLFLGNPTIRSKLRNFAFLKMDLGIKIAVAGTPFHYGKLLVSYQPFPSVNQNLVFVPARRAARLRYLSQAIGATTMDVRSNAPLELHVPYISPQPIGRLYNDANVALGTGSNFDDFDDLGTLYISTLNQIKAVSTAATNVFIYIYVYAKNVTLTGSTGSVLAVTTESDEREIGPVEKVSSALLPYSRALETVPSIGMFAKASSIALGALKSVSALFGWAYPTMIQAPNRVRPDPYQNGAQTVGFDTGKKITLDPKQELSVDPRIAAISDDEMAISTICKKESLLDTFNWAPASTPLTSIMWTAAVTPRASLVDVIGTAPNQYLATVPTPLGFAATPFAYWRGSIKYRFEVVASNFHRGKLMFVYEPNIRHFSLVTAALNVNKQYVKVIDIQETQVIEFCVDWNFPRMWAENIVDQDVNTTVGSQFTNTSSKFDTCNGCIFVTPFTALQSPDGSSVSINVYVSSDDMAFNRMTSKNYPVSIAPYTQSDERQLDKTTIEEVTCMELAPSVLSKDHISELHFGEQPVSFRSLLKRFMQGPVIITTTQANRRLVQFVVRNYAENTYADTLPAGGGLGAPQVRTLHNYLRFAYLGQKGGLRWRAYLNRNSSTVGDYRFLVSLNNETNTTSANTFFEGSSTATRGPVMDGTVTFLSTVNNGIEYEIPYYNNNLFSWACNSDPYFSTNLSVVQADCTRMHSIFAEGLDGTALFLNTSFATGEDYSMIRWLGAPPIRLNGTVA